MELRVNLKVCEGCGCLWYRTHLDTRVYCPPCHERFKDFPTASPRIERRGRHKKKTGLTAVLQTVHAVEDLSYGARDRSWDSSRDRSFTGMHNPHAALDQASRIQTAGAR